MRRLVWDTSFRRAFKQRTRRQPLLQKRILDVLAALVENPFEPNLKTHKSKYVLNMLECERVVRLHITHLPEGVYLATSEDIQGLVAQGRTVAETVEIARDIARKLTQLPTTKPPNSYDPLF